MSDQRFMIERVEKAIAESEARIMEELRDLGSMVGVLAGKLGVDGDELERLVREGRKNNG